MTKKSAGRQLRDEQAREADNLAVAELPNNNWESLMQCYRTSIAMFQQYNGVAHLLQNDAVKYNLVDPQATANLTKSMSADVTMLLTETRELYARHQGKTGQPKDHDEFFEVTMMFQQYADLTSRHELLILPVLAEINEHIVVAIDNGKKKLAEEQAAQALLDPNVTSDVEFTNVPSNTEAANEHA